MFSQAVSQAIRAFSAATSLLAFNQLRESAAGKAFLKRLIIHLDTLRHLTDDFQTQHAQLKVEVDTFINQQAIVGEHSSVGEFIQKVTAPLKRVTQTQQLCDHVIQKVIEGMQDGSRPVDFSAMLTLFKREYSRACP